MKKIELTQGHHAVVDDEDYDFLNQYSWRADVHNHTIYARNDHLGLMHRLILRAAPNQLCDHKDGNGLNCVKDNLRFATPSQNNINSARSEKSRGVTYRENNRFRKWEASIRIDGKTVYLGSFDTEIEAANAYDEQAKKHHGEFAFLNNKDLKT